MLLVGFVQTPERYPLLSQTLAPQLDGLVDFAVLMQAGSPERLLWACCRRRFLRRCIWRRHSAFTG